MKLAIMQPYLLPYIGYFQLVASVDRFVFYDDVAFIKNGWINRNRWRVRDEAAYFTIPLRGARAGSAIAKVQVQPPAAWRRQLLATLRQNYCRAPHYEEVASLFERVLDCAEAGIGAMARHSVRSVSDYLGLPTDFVESSSFYGNSALRGRERVLDICRREGATSYINLPSGRTLYAEADFGAQGLQLRFIEPHLQPYAQSRPGFVAGLSVLDLLMHCDVEQARAHLGLKGVQ